ncbi:uncharacterized protein LOC136038795 [Artemia franciscana]|uniref:uncharacterized protein LOC136038795 n=1 Tax=Artemia franciscana TaxID=6661 RepID=UPI0032DA71CA
MISNSNSEMMDSYQTDYAELPPTLSNFINYGLQMTISKKWKSDLDVNESIFIGNSPGKTDNILLADLGLGNYAPEFSQSEYDLRNKQKEKKMGGARFLSQERYTHVSDANRKNASDWTLSCSYNDVTCSSFSVEITEDIGNLDESSALSKSSLHSSLPALVRTYSGPCAVCINNGNSTNEQIWNEETLTPSKSSNNICVMSRGKLKHFPIGKKGWVADNLGPFMPRTHNELSLGCRVKVIHASGQVLAGWVRYIGPLPGVNDTQIGIELMNAGPGGDGLYDGKQIFSWLVTIYQVC